MNNKLPMDTAYYLMKSVAEAPQWMIYSSTIVLAIEAVLLGIASTRDRNDRNKTSLDNKVDKLTDEDYFWIGVVGGSAGGGH